MPVNKPYLYEAGIHFITFTNYKWLALIALTNSYDLVYKWFDYLKTNGHYISGYVIMPNHLRALIAFNTSNDKSLNSIIGNGKRFLAYGIVQRLKDARRTDILQQLADGVKPKDRSRSKLHEVFEPSFDIKECMNMQFINQKLDYMHNNPVTKKWTLADNPINYPHSSARFYETGEQGLYPVTNFMELIDKNWSESSTILP